MSFQVLVNFLVRNSKPLVLQVLLQNEFPGISEFSRANLCRMRLFYETFANNEKLAPMVREIGWTHNFAVSKSFPEMSNT
jgi:DUF1016 N-terminal domain